MNPNARLAELGIVLPTPPVPLASYVPYVRSGNLLFFAGQIPLRDGAVAYTGKLGDEVTMETGQTAAQLCAINLLAHAQAALGNLDKVVRVVKLTGFVACTAEFTAHPSIINAASDLMFAVFEEAGRHARSSVGVPSLPYNTRHDIGRWLRQANAPANCHHAQAIAARR
jgi:enamine deaminase RidA (YjgF/YER057c/UK114 family)